MGILLRRSLECVFPSLGIFARYRAVIVSSSNWASVVYFSICWQYYLVHRHWLLQLHYVSRIHSASIPQEYAYFPVPVYVSIYWIRRNGDGWVEYFKIHDGLLSLSDFIVDEK